MKRAARACTRRAMFALAPFLVSMGTAQAAAGDAESAASAASAIAMPSTLASGISPSLPLRRGAEAAWSGAGSSALAVIALAILLAMVVGWALWRRGWAPRSMRSVGGLRATQATRLTARASVHVVHWDGRQWLIACTDHAVAVLGERPEAAGAVGGEREGLKANT